MTLLIQNLFGYVMDLRPPMRGNALPRMRRGACQFESCGVRGEAPLPYHIREKSGTASPQACVSAVFAGLERPSRSGRRPSNAAMEISMTSSASFGVMQPTVTMSQGRSVAQEKFKPT